MSDQENTAAGITGAELGMLFHRAARLLARAYHRRDHAHHAQEHVLGIVRERGSITQAELLEILDVRSSSLSEVLAKLERAGLITRERNEADRRGFVISPTDKAAGQEGEQGGMAGVSPLFACLDDAERAQLAGLLRKLTANLEDDPLCHGECHGHGHGPGHAHGMGHGRGCRHEHGLGRGHGGHEFGDHEHGGPERGGRGGRGLGGRRQGDD